MAKVFITRKIPESGIKLLQDKGFEVEVNQKDQALTKQELKEKVKSTDALLCLLTDKIDEEILEVGLPKLKIVANYAVGFDNIDIKAATDKKIYITNTPEVLTETVAEHTFALMLAIARRIVESDKFTRQGKYKGWEPELFLGNDIYRKTLAIIGLGRIGSAVAKRAVKGFDMKLIYYDIKSNSDFEKEYSAKYFADLDDCLKEADFVSLHIPLLSETHHLISKEKLSLMKKTAYLINTSRGPVVDETALVEALKAGIIKGAALDVFEHEPDLAEGLKDLSNVILTPHTASATEETRSKMSELAALNIIDVLEEKQPRNWVNKW